MIFKDTNLKDAKLITTFVQNDCRGSFIKDFHHSEFMEHNINFVIKEEMETISKKGVIRGMHFQLYKPQAKLVRCIKGEIFDYIVDARKNSPTYLQGQGFILSEENNNCLYVPKGFLHGYLVIDDSVVTYKCDEEFYKDGDSVIRYDDRTLNIDWHIDKFIGNSTKIILSEKDNNAPSFEYYIGKFENIT